MKLAEVYKKSLDKQWFIRLKTKHPLGDNYDGIVLKETQSFIVIAVERDFEFDGVQIIPKKFIKGFRDGQVEQATNNIIRFNAQIRKFKLPIWLQSCEQIADILKQLMKRSIWPAIETIFNKRSSFYLGPILSVEKDKFCIHCYNPEGEWEKKHRIDINNLFRVEINSKYTNHFNNFMKSKHT